MEYILNKDYAKVWWEPATNSVCLEWHGFVSDEKFREPMNLLLETIVEKKGCAIFTDSRDMHELTPEDQQWVLEVWMPKAAENGLNKIGTLSPKSSISKLSFL